MSKFKFVADNIYHNRAHPALATWQARPFTDEWKQFVHHWPYTVPCGLHEHCVNHDFDFEIKKIDTCTGPEYFYSIGIGFFDFTIDYFSLVPKQVYDNGYKILFYYHEGDNPFDIKQRMDSLCRVHKLDLDCYKFVSGNTQADQIKNFVWFPDHELLYWNANRHCEPCAIHTQSRPYEFTLLSRTHKWWRAIAVADLHQQAVLDRSLWSYNTEQIINDHPSTNPFSFKDVISEKYLQVFMQQGPYTCDQLTAHQHNDHSLLVADHFTKSYCHIVLETHFDVDQSGGTFVTEKTFKPIKHGQPFVRASGPGTLQVLRDLGYRTFDHAIDNSYDLEPDNTRRLQKLVQAIKQIRNQDMHTWFMSCLEDVIHNQKLFLSTKKQRLNNLYDKLLY